jgi:hypothetical protein
MRYRRDGDKRTGLKPDVNWDTAQTIKRLANEMDVSASSLVNAILAKALALNSASTSSADNEGSSGSRDASQ